MTAYAIAFLSGTLLRLTSPNGVVALFILVSAIAAAAWCSGRWRGVMLCLLWACAGWALAWLSANDYLRLRWPEALASERVLVDAIVESIPTASSHGTTFDANVRVLTPQRNARHLRAKLASTFHARLTWRGRYIPVHAGERWQLLVTLRPPRARFNPGTLDMELHWFRERVHALGTVVESRLNRQVGSGHQPLNELRERIVRRIQARVEDRDAAALIAALAVGSTGDLSREQWRVFNATGTSHLIAISGLHVTLFAVIALAAARWLWRFTVWRFNVPREVFACWFALAAAGAYAVLAGFSVPTQRTLIMLAVWLLARASSRCCGPLTTLSLALILVVLLDPFAPLAAGFWLSFGAIAAILLVTQGRVAPATRAREAMRVQLAVTLALVPVTLACFGCVPITGMLVNVLAIPLFSFVLVPLVLLSFVHIATLDVVAWLYLHTWPAFVWAANSPVSLLYVAPPTLWYVGAVPAIAISLLPWPVYLRAACVLWLLPTARAAPDVPSVGGVKMTVLDAGQNTAIVIRTAHHVLFYGDAERVSEYTLLPYLRSQGVRPENVTTVHPNTPKMSTWQWDGVSFHIRCPPGTDQHPNCVMRITTATSSILLTDRLDARAEKQWVSAGLQPADVVTIPRHGGNVASSSEFIAAIAPRWALVTGAMRPAAALWRAHGARVLATADSGAIHITIDPVTGLLPPVAARQNYLALWRALP